MLYGNIYHQYTPSVSIYTIHGSYGYHYLLSSIVVYHATATALSINILVQGLSPATQQTQQELATILLSPGLKPRTANWVYPLVNIQKANWKSPSLSSVNHL